MLKRVVLGILLAAVGPAFSVSQQSSPAAPTISVSTRLVQVELIATGKDGKAVTDLRPADVELSENGHTQKLASFEFHSTQVPSLPLPPLPKGIYSNRRQLAENAPAIIVLLDALNTPFLDQAYARDQMLKYVRSQAAGDRQVAIFALTRDLILLQDFTSDPKLLQRAAESLSSQPSALLKDENDQSIYIPGAPAQVLQNLRRFEEESVATKMDIRVRTTLSALEWIAKIVAGVPGRKTLVWISGAFPLNLRPREGFDAQRWYLDQVERTASLLSDAHIAVYPVDARGLATSSVFSADFTGLNPDGTLMNGPQLGDELSVRSFQLMSTHDSMNEIAGLTGGTAYYNRNDIDHALSLAVEDGSSYYALSYYPTDKKWDGRFRRIEIRSLRPALALRYRQGYYALDPSAAVKMSAKDVKNQMSAALTQPVLSTEVVFFATVAARMSALSRSAVRNMGSVSPSALPVQFLLDTKELGFDAVDDGRERCSVELVVAAFSGKKLLTEETRHEQCDLDPPSYALSLKHGLVSIVPIDLPAGNYRLRLLVRDNLRGRIGTLDIPYTQPKS